VRFMIIDDFEPGEAVGRFRELGIGGVEDKR
jgi:hypothetical protein